MVMAALLVLLSVVVVVVVLAVLVEPAVAAMKNFCHLSLVPFFSISSYLAGYAETYDER